MATNSHIQAQDQQKLLIEFYIKVGEALAKAGLTEDLFIGIKDRPHQLASVVGYMKTLSIRPKGLRGSSS